MNKLEINIVDLRNDERLIIVVFIPVLRDAAHIWIKLNFSVARCFSVCRENAQ